MNTGKFKVLTLGCKVNQYESRFLAESLKEAGLSQADGAAAADLVVINTCTVTHKSDTDARALIRRALRENPGARVVVSGCQAAVDPETALELGADLVYATADKRGLAALSLSGRKGIVRPEPESAHTLEAEPVKNYFGRKRAYLKVQDGCDAFCAYCIVPYARGAPRSLPPVEVKEGLRRLSRAGHLEVVLAGIHLGFWGRDLDPKASFADLLAIAEESDLQRIRISSIEPMELTDEVISAVAASGKVCPHFHIPLQSGSDRILKLMGRPYTSADVMDRISKALSKMEGLALGFDVMAGFPGETGEDFDETVKFLESLPLAYLHVFPYSPRAGTRAFDMPGRVPPRETARRTEILRELSAAKKESRHKAHIGMEMCVIIEKKLPGGTLFGHTSNYLEVEIADAGEITGAKAAARLLGWNGKRLTAAIRS